MGGAPHTMYFRNCCIILSFFPIITKQLVRGVGLSNATLIETDISAVNSVQASTVPHTFIYSNIVSSHGRCKIRHLLTLLHRSLSELDRLERLTAPPQILAD